MGSLSASAAQVQFDASDIGKTITVRFDGNVERTYVEGLTARADVQLTAFTPSAASFFIRLADTSFEGISSRVTVLGFDVSAPMNSALVAGVWDAPGYVLNGSFPNRAGTADICFTSGTSCQGGGNGGIPTGHSGAFTATLFFNTPVSTIDLNDFKVRYQSVTGTNLGNSGTGTGYADFGDGSAVPEPGTYALCAAGLLAVAFAGRRKARNSRSGLSA